MTRNNKQYLERAWTEYDEALGKKRRRHARFDAALHVAYLTEAGAPAVAYSQNLSAGGMYLREAPGLVAGRSNNFIITLDDGDMPLEVRGEVLAVNQHGVRVCFAPNQAGVPERLQRFITTQIVPELEAEAARPVPELHHILELAHLYAEQNRYDEAMGLYRRQLQKRPRQQNIYEHAAHLLCTNVIMQGEASDTALEEMHTLVERGLALGPSDALEAAKKTHARFAAKRREGEEIRAQVEAARQAVERRDAVLNERTDLLAQREADLAAAHAQLKTWEATLDTRDEALDAREAGLQNRATGLQTATAQLESRAASLQSATAAHAERQSGLEVREQTVVRLGETLAQRQQDLAEQSRDVIERRLLIEERERSLAALKVQLQARDEAQAAREQALDEATTRLQNEQAEHAARRDANSRALDAMRENYTHSMTDILQRVRAFAAGLRVKLTARDEEVAAMRASLAAQNVTLTQREQALATSTRRLEQDRRVFEERQAEAAKMRPPPPNSERLAKLDMLLQQAEEDIATRDQALALLKQTLGDTRAQLELRNAQLATATEERVIGKVEGNAGSTALHASELHMGDFDVVDMEQVSSQSAGTDEPLEPTPRWRMR